MPFRLFRPPSPILVPCILILLVGVHFSIDSKLNLLYIHTLLSENNLVACWCPLPHSLFDWRCSIRVHHS